MRTKDEQIQTFEYKTEMKQLLNLIVHSLYTHPEIFLRELISNASDALNKVRFRTLTDRDNIIDPDSELSIKIEVDEKNKTFSIEDNGIGMNKDDIINNIGTVARSGTLEFLEKIKENKAGFNENLIGQFGVGFYSVFMVTDEVTIETREASSDSTGYKWQSKGEGNFTIEEISKQGRGTKISFKFKESSEEFSTEFKIKEIINKYSNFADFPIFLNKEKINTINAIWCKKETDVTDSERNEFYKFITNDYDDPMGHLHISLEGAVNFKALIFIPKNAPLDFMRLQNEKSLNLYSNKILIQNDCKDLLPDYLKFVKGVVDTVDLPLNVSREVTQNSPVMVKIKNVLTSKILGLLETWAKNDTEKYMDFYKKFGVLLKSGINTDFTNRDKLINLLRFETSLQEKDKFSSLKDYVSRMKDDQKEIYYLSSDNRNTIEQNPNLEYFKKNDIEVLLLTDPADIFVVPSIGEYDKKPIKSIDKADLDIKDKNKADEKFSKSLTDLFKSVLKDKVEDVVVSKRLVDSAVTLVAGQNAMDTQMEKLMKTMNKDFSGSKRILEINMDHPLISNLSKMHIANSADPMLEKCILQLYEGALCMEGNLSNQADFVKRMVDIMQKATK